MAQLDVEKKKDSGNDWWKWLLGILALVVIIWLILEFTGNDDQINNQETTGYVKDVLQNSQNNLRAVLRA
jgi:hypothetical protein